VPIGESKELRKLRKKVDELEAEVENLSKKAKVTRIEMIVSFTAEIITIIAGILAIAEFLL